MLLALPPELLTHVSALLPPAGVCALSATCRQLRALELPRRYPHVVHVVRSRSRKITAPPPPFKRLELYLGGTAVTDAGLPHLAGVHTLDLRCTRVTDAGLPHLAGVHTLYLGGTRVTQEGREWLRSRGVNVVG